MNLIRKILRKPRKWDRLDDLPIEGPMIRSAHYPTLAMFHDGIRWYFWTGTSAFAAIDEDGPFVEVR